MILIGLPLFKSSVTEILSFPLHSSTHRGGDPSLIHIVILFNVPPSFSIPKLPGGGMRHGHGLGCLFLLLDACHVHPLVWGNDTEAGEAGGEGGGWERCIPSLPIFSP